jgi:hypothetical protein
LSLGQVGHSQFRQGQKRPTRGIFPIYKKEDRSFAGLSAGRRREKFTPAEAENRAFCQ